MGGFRPYGKEKGNEDSYNGLNYYSVVFNSQASASDNEQRLLYCIADQDSVIFLAHRSVTALHVPRDFFPTSCWMDEWREFTLSDPLKSRQNRSQLAYLDQAQETN